MNVSDYVELWRTVFVGLGVTVHGSDFLYEGRRCAIDVFWPANDADDYLVLELILGAAGYEILGSDFGEIHDGRSIVTINWFQGVTTSGVGDGIDEALARAIELKLRSKHIMDSLC